MALDQFLSAIMLVEKLERFLVAHQLQFGHNQLFDLCRKRTDGRCAKKTAQC